MKISALVLARVFGELAAGLPFALALQLVTDEETGGRDGTAHQVGQGVRADFVIIGEPTGLDIATDTKGVAAVTLRAAGRSGHGAYPWLGDNALVKLLTSLARILDAYPVPAQEEWRTTVSLTRIQTPNQARNQIPGHAEAWLDVRYPPEDPQWAGQTAQEITGFLAGFCEPGVTPVIDRLDPARHADRDHPDVRRLGQAARSQGYRAGFLRKHGSGDGRFYNQPGTAAVAFGIGGTGLHGDDEHADITTIKPYYQALTEFLRDTGPP
jgi:succinyl-diaminopimelate desuccinylase